MADTTRVNFTKPAAERIAAVVRKVEQGSRDQGALTFSKPLDQGGGGGGSGAGTTLRLCRTTATFTKGTLATLQIWEDCQPPNEAASKDDNGNTRTLGNVVNKYATISSGRWVSVAKHGNGYYYVVSAECG